MLIMFFSWVAQEAAPNHWLVIGRSPSRNSLVGVSWVEDGGFGTPSKHTNAKISLDTV